MNSNWKTIIRDALLIMCLTFLGGFLVGYFSSSQEDAITLLGLSNAALCTIAFCVIGAFAIVNRFSHLIKVAFTFWLMSSANVLFGMPVMSWVFSIVAIFIFMGVGGFVSFFFVRAPKLKAKENT